MKILHFFDQQTNLFELIRTLKESMTTTPLDFQKEIESNLSTQEFCFGNGQVMSIGKERFQCSEALFTPYLLGSSLPGIQEMAFKSMLKCDSDIKIEIFRNILLSGGTSYIPGLVPRLEKEIRIFGKLQENNAVEVNQALMVLKINMIDKYAAWLGGSVLASLSTFQQQWISREEYDEEGPKYIVNRRLIYSTIIIINSL